MRRLVSIGLTLGLTGCLSFEDGGRFKCDPKTGKDCDYILPSSNVKVENGRFEPATGEIAGNGYAVVGGTLFYAGTLTANGSPVTGTHAVGLALYDAASGGSSACPEQIHPGVDFTASAGRFRLPLHLDCGAAIQANPDLWVKVTVDGTDVGRSQIGAVPLAVSAARSERALTSDVALTVPWSGIQGTAMEGTGVATTAARSDHSHSTVGTISSLATGALRMESVTFAGPTAGSNCTANPCTVLRSSSSWLTSVQRRATAQFTLNIAPGTFSGPPTCVATGVSVGWKPLVCESADYLATATSVNVACINNSDSAFSLEAMASVICMGPR